MTAKSLPDGSMVTLSSGATVYGHPHDTPSYRKTARRLGYDSALAMCQDHDCLHALLCDWLGLGDSFSLRCAAGLRAEDELSAAEETAVLAVQRFMRLSGAALPSRVRGFR